MIRERHAPAITETPLADRRYRITVEQYHAMGPAMSTEERTELLDGEIFTMSPIGTLHSWSNDQLIDLIIDACRADGLKYRFDQPVRINEINELQPDITVLRPRANKDRVQHPTPSDVVLLIEIADTTLSTDRTIKAQIYGESGVPEYWIVDLNHRQIIVMSEPSATGYRSVRTYQTGETVTTAAVPSLNVAVNDVVPSVADLQP